MWIGVTLQAPAAADLASKLSLAKSHLRALHTSEDDLIASYLAAAVSHVEKVTGSRFYSAEATLLATAWADLDNPPVAPIASVEEITYVPLGETAAVTVTPTAIIIENNGDRLTPRVAPAHGHVWPSAEPGQPITVKAKVGYSTPPAEVWQAVALLVGQWFAHRTPVSSGGSSSDLPNGVHSLLANHKRHLL